MSLVTRGKMPPPAWLQPPFGRCRKCRGDKVTLPVPQAEHPPLPGLLFPALVFQHFPGSMALLWTRSGPSVPGVQCGPGADTALGCGLTCARYRGQSLPCSRCPHRWDTDRMSRAFPAPWARWTWSAVELGPPHRYSRSRSGICKPM